MPVLKRQWKTKLLIGAVGCFSASIATQSFAQNGGPGPDLDPGGLGTQRVDLPDIQVGGITLFANPLGNAGSGGLTQLATTSAFADSLFFSDRDGEVRRFDVNTGTASVLFDVDTRRAAFQVNGAASGQGLRGLAFHPDFNNQGSAGYGKIYTAHEEAFNTAPANRPLLATNALGQAFQSDGGRQDGVIAEWDYDFNTDSVVAGSGRDVYRVQIPFSDHVLQQIGFNPNSQPGDSDYGLLYAGIGDGGGSVSPGPGVDTNRVGQDFRTPLSSIIRIDPIQQSGATSFGIPNDNPFAGVNEDPNIPGEIYAKGFRHPQTLGFDPATGKIFSGDIGQNNIDEINVIEPGDNYGYSQLEGTYVYLDQRSPGNGQNADVSLFEVPLNSTANIVVQTDGGNVNQVVGPRNSDGFSYPAIQVDHVENAVNGATAIVGGSVYNGTLAPDLEGQYLFGFLSSNVIASADASLLDTDGSPTQPASISFVDENGSPITINQPLGTGTRTLMRFGQDQAGEIYVFSQITGNIVRLEGAPEPPPPMPGEIVWGAAQELIDSTDLIAGAVATLGANGGPESGLTVNGVVYESFPNSGGFSEVTGQPSFITVTADGGTVNTFGLDNDSYDIPTDSADLDSILSTHVFEGGDTAPLTVTISGLVVGAEYQIQLLSPFDTRGCCSDRTVLVDGGNAGDGVDLPRLADLDGDQVEHGTFAIGTFVADATTIEFTQTGDFSGGFSALILAQMTTGILADLDNDGDVDDADFGLAFAAFTGPDNGPSSNPAADLDGDGDVDDADFGIAFAAFTGPGGAANVPEPTSLALLGVGGLLAARRRRA